jgi:hypothetical protein
MSIKFLACDFIIYATSSDVIYQDCLTVLVRYYLTSIIFNEKKKTLKLSEG